MGNIVQLLCDLSEASGEDFRESMVECGSRTDLRLLTELGAIAPGPRPDTVTCAACNADHAGVIEFDRERHCYVHFCPEAGFVTVNDVDLITHRFRPEWLVDWLAKTLDASLVRHRVLVPESAWHLGEAACGNTLMTIIFARRVTGQADLDLLISALRPVQPANKGLVITTSPHVARQVPLPNGFEFLDLRDIAVFTSGLPANDRLGVRLESVTLNIPELEQRVAIAKDKTTIHGGGGKGTEPAVAASPRINTSRQARGTAAQETKLKKWLVSHMAAAPMEPRPKATIQRAAIEIGLEFSARAFERSWRIAVLESGASAWSAPGRRPAKRIDTRT